MFKAKISLHSFCSNYFQYMNHMQADLEDGLTDVRDPPWAPVVGAAEDVASVEFLSEVNPAYQVRFNKFAFLVKKI